MPAHRAVRIAVYDAFRREVARPVDGEVGPGEHAMELDARGLASGVYFVWITAGTFRETQKVVLVR